MAKKPKKIIEKNKRDFKETFVDFYNEHSEKEFVVSILTALYVVHAGIITFRYLWCVVRLDRIIISNAVPYMLLAAAVPFIVWAFSTTLTWYNYRNRKFFLLKTCIVNAILTLAQPVYHFLWTKLVPKVLQIEVNRAMTENMVVNLARMAVGIPTLLLVVALIYVFFQIIDSEEGRKKIGAWKLSSTIDMRPNHAYLYDLNNVVKDLNTGESITIKEQDRYVGTLLNGVSGVGKTSSAILNSINDDFVQKTYNREKRQLALANMLMEEKAYIPKYYPEFDESLIVPLDEYKGEYEEILNKYSNAGVTFMAPNNTVFKKILQLAEAKRIKVNVIDPEKDWTKEFSCVSNKNIDSFYIPLGLSEEQRIIQITSQAAVFTDVLVALNETSGNVDPYFKDINKSVTTNISIAVMLANNIRGKQTGILEIQNCIDNFMELKPYIAEIEKYYGSVKTTIAFDNKNSKDAMDSVRSAMDKDKQKKEQELEEQDTRENPYRSTIVFIKQELLSDKNFEKMYDQARGLRNLLSNSLLIDLRVRRLLTATEDNRLDFDKMLYNGEITLVNTAIAFSQSISTALGLFFQLNMKIAVLRRPENNRVLHSLIIDECSQYVHPFFNEVVSLYRQYGIAVTLSIQSLDQLTVSKATEFLSTLFQTVGCHIVFGRLSAREMELYQKLSGNEMKDLIQYTISQSSLLDTNSINRSERTSPTKVAKKEGAEMRYKGFQEVTVFYTDENDVREPRDGKVNFLPKKAFRPLKETKIQWEEFMPEKDVPIDIDIEKDIDLLHKTEENVLIFETKTEQIREDIANPHNKRLEEEKQRLSEMNNIDINTLLFGSQEDTDEDSQQETIASSEDSINADNISNEEMERLMKKLDSLKK